MGGVVLFVLLYLCLYLHDYTLDYSERENKFPRSSGSAYVLRLYCIMQYPSGYKSLFKRILLSHLTPVDGERFPLITN